MGGGTATGGSHPNSPEPKILSENKSYFTSIEYYFLSSIFIFSSGALILIVSTDSPTTLPNESNI